MLLVPSNFTFSSIRSTQNNHISIYDLKPSDCSKGPWAIKIEQQLKLWKGNKNCNLLKNWCTRRRTSDALGQPLIQNSGIRCWDISPICLHFLYSWPQHPAYLHKLHILKKHKALKRISKESFKASPHFIPDYHLLIFLVQPKLDDFWYSAKDLSGQ